MPFGLKCASNTFIRTVQRILQPIRDFCDSYVDDMATFSDEWSLHLQHIRAFLDEIRKSGLTLNLHKTEFAKSEVTFVGHIIGSGRHGPDPSRVEVVEHMKPPTTKKEVRQMIGFFSYFRQYIAHFADVAHPLTELTKKNAPNQVQWGLSHEHAFNELRKRLCEVTKLHTVSPKQPFGLMVDASGKNVGLSNVDVRCQVYISLTLKVSDSHAVV